MTPLCAPEKVTELLLAIKNRNWLMMISKYMLFVRIRFVLREREALFRGLVRPPFWLQNERLGNGAYQIAYPEFQVLHS